MTKQIIYKEVIEIDGREYTVTTCDYSDTIKKSLITLLMTLLIHNDSRTLSL